MNIKKYKTIIVFFTGIILFLFLGSIFFKMTMTKKEDPMVYFNYLKKHYEDNLNKYNPADFAKRKENNNLEYIAFFKDPNAENTYNVYVYCKKEKIVIYYAVYVDKTRVSVIPSETFIFTTIPPNYRNLENNIYIYSLLNQLNTFTNDKMSNSAQQEELINEMRKHNADDYIIIIG